MNEPKSVKDLLTTRLLILSNTLSLYSSRYYRQQFGVTMPEWRVMSILASRDGATARDISRALATDKAWVGLSVKCLADRGFLTRSSDAKDTRRVRLSLTKQGREMHDAIMAVARRRQERLLATLPEGSAEVLNECLDRLQAEAEAMVLELDPTGSDAAS